MSIINKVISFRLFLLALSMILFITSFFGLVHLLRMSTDFWFSSFNISVSTPLGFNHYFLFFNLLVKFIPNDPDIKANIAYQKSGSADDKIDQPLSI